MSNRRRIKPHITNYTFFSHIQMPSACNNVRTQLIVSLLPLGALNIWGSSSCRRAPQERVSEYRLIASRKGACLDTPPPRSSGLSFIIISRYQTFLFFLNIFSSQTPSLDRFSLLQVISDAANSRQTSSPLT